MSQHSERSTQHPILPPPVVFGQGKCVTTVLTPDGCIYPIIANEAKSDRMQFHSIPRCIRGERTMHRSTLTLAKPPWVPDYTTTTKQFHGGSAQGLRMEPRPTPSRSMHVSQFQLGSSGVGCEDTNCNYPGLQKTDDVWQTDYRGNYPPKEDIIPANRLHLISFVNRINQNEGIGIKGVVKVCKEPINYFTQYKRVHDKLAHLRGPGVERECQIKEHFNVLTGEPLGPSWQMHNPRKSGNRVLHAVRKQPAPVIL